MMFFSTRVMIKFKLVILYEIFRFAINSILIAYFEFEFLNMI